MTTLSKIENLCSVPTIEKLNIVPQDDIGTFLYEDHKKALEILSNKKNTLQKINDEELNYILKQFQSTAEFIPASQDFMKNVKKTFKEKQVNFTIQNYLTWHFIDSVLLSYFTNNEERFNKFKECAVTELDMIFVDALDKMLKCVSDYSMDEIRYMYFVDTVPKLLPYYHYYVTKKEDNEKMLDKIVKSRNGANNVPIEALYAYQLVFQRNFLMRMHIQNVIASRKSQYGASPYKLNEEYYGNIVYKGYKGLYKPLEKGDIVIKKIKNIKDIDYYFKNRHNAFSILSSSDDLRGAYINNTLVGVMGILNGNVNNIHVDGDYRLKGVAKSLIKDFLKDISHLCIIPIGDSLSFVKKISKYVKKNNMGIITLETLTKEELNKDDIKHNTTIINSNESPLSIVGEQFKDYINKYQLEHPDSNLNVKVAVLNNIVIGHIIFDKKERKIVVLEVDSKYKNSGIGNKLLNSVVDYNIWNAEIGKTGILFWFGKGLINGYTVYLCNSEKRLNKFSKENKIKQQIIPTMHIL